MIKNFMVVAMMVLLSVAGCSRSDQPLNDHDIVPIKITRSDGTSVALDVEMAITPPVQEKGLMFRQSLPRNGGMLFTFADGERERAFWMRNTLIPLDIVFIRQDGRILSIHQNAIPHDETLLRSNGPSNAVLEINGGRAAELGLKPGDVVHHQFFK